MSTNPTRLNRRSVLASMGLLALLPRSRAAAKSGHSIVKLDKLVVISVGGAKRAVALTNDLQRYAQLLSTLTPIGGPGFTIELDYLVLGGAAMQRLRRETDRFGTAVSGSRYVSSLLIQPGRHVYVCNGDALRDNRLVIDGVLYRLTEHALKAGGLGAAWYTTGHASLMNGLRFATGADVTVGKMPPALGHTARGGAWLPLRRMFAMSLDDAVREKQGPAYIGQTWLLAHYASFQDPSLRPQVEAAARAMARGVAVEEAWASAGPRALDEFETTLDAYRRGDLRAYTYSLREFQSATSGVRDLSQEELDAALTEVIDRLDRSDA